MSIAKITTKSSTKNAVEIRTELQAGGTKIEYIYIDGMKCGILGSLSDADRAAALKVLQDTYIASNGNIMEMMSKLNTIATIEEKEINPDEMVTIRGRQVMLSYKDCKAYNTDGKEVADCNDLSNMPVEAVKAVLMARADAALK